MTTPLVVVGAGGFGREVVDLAEAVNDAAGSQVWQILGVLDDDPSAMNLTRLADRAVPYLGKVDAYLASARPVSYVIGVGNPAVRRHLAMKLSGAGHAPVTLVHPTVSMGSRVSIGQGTVICAGARLTTNISVGSHVHINLSATIGHDSVIEDFVSINPLVAISGDCTLRTGALLGVGAAVLNGLAVGERAVIGGAACVVRDVPADVTVKGVPAR